jgi:Domain of unknown function (DUF3291)
MYAHGKENAFMAGFELAQLNVARMKDSIDSPLLADFVANLDRINAIAENTPGYVWRLQTDDGNATALRPFGDDMLVNLSVWRDVNALKQFVFGAQHSEIMRRRGEWFHRMEAAYVVLWWVAAGHRPDVGEAKHRLHHLQTNGPSPTAFTLRDFFEPSVPL